MMPKSLKIIIFDGSFKTTPFINRLLEGLVHNQHKVYVLGFNEALTTKIAQVNYVPLGSNQNKWRLIVTTLKLYWTNKNKASVCQALGNLIKGKRTDIQKQNVQFAINKIKPDVIHAQWTSVLPWLEEILEAQKIPVILSQRGYHSNIRPFVNQDNFNYLKHWYPKIAGFHSVSKAISKKGDDIYKATDKKNHVVYTGIDFEKLPFNKSLPTTKTLEVISVGRAHWIKGYDNALQSCQLLKEQDIDFKYTIIGAAGDEELQFLRHDLGLENHVNLIGRLPQEDVFKRMQNANVLVVSSIAEGVPNVVVEAMALGVPVISTACGGVEELIENNTNGWLVPTRNPKALAEALIKFNQLPKSTIENIRISAHKKVEAQHSETKMIADMEALYKTVIKAKS